MKLIKLIFSTCPNHFKTKTSCKSGFVVYTTAMTGKISDNKAASSYLCKYFINDSVIIFPLVNPEWFVTGSYDRS